MSDIVRLLRLQDRDQISTIKKLYHFMPQIICAENSKVREKVIEHKLQRNLFSFTSQTSDLKVFRQNEMQTPWEPSTPTPCY